MKSIFTLLIALSLFGCAFLKQASEDVKSCASDNSCLQESVEEANQAKQTAIAFAGISPIPLSSNLIGGIVYGGALLLALRKRGRKKREQESGN